jgi:Glyoxalase-like domain
MTALIDHLVVTAGTLAAASAHVTAALGVEPGPEGKHAAMGTHNRLVSLGEADYLEAIAPDPDAAAPGRPRWFGLDGAAAARLSHWALRVDDLDAALAEAPAGIGPAIEMERGAYRWRITVPQDGVQPFAGMFPALIAWTGAPPAPALDDIGARLVRLTVSHPQAGPLGWALSMLTSDDRVVVRRGPLGLSALIHTENGEVTLT